MKKVNLRDFVLLSWSPAEGDAGIKPYLRGQKQLSLVAAQNAGVLALNEGF